MKNYGDWANLAKCEIPNKKNPYDNAGAEHNRLMAVIESKGNPKMTLDEVFDLCDDVLREEFGSQLIPNYSSKKLATPIINIDSEREFETYINSLSLNQETKGYLFELYDILFEYDSTNLCSVVGKVKEFEDRILASKGSANIENILISSSVGRYSLAYWNDRYGNETFVARAFWKKFFTAVADCVGATAGAIAGSATVVGGIAGGITGAIGASAGFSRVWDVFAN